MEIKVVTDSDKTFVMSIDHHVNDIGYRKMKNQGYQMTLLSTQVDEDSQHLYRKLGYIDCGGLVFHHTPFDQPMEMFLRKVL